MNKFVECLKKSGWEVTLLEAWDDAGSAKRGGVTLNFGPVGIGTETGVWVTVRRKLVGKDPKTVMKQVERLCR